MRKNTLRQQYIDFTLGKKHVKHFLTEARNSKLFGITPLHTLNDIVGILKAKSVITESDFSKHDSLIRELENYRGKRPTHQYMTIQELERELEACRGTKRKLSEEWPEDEWSKEDPGSVFMNDFETEEDSDELMKWLDYGENLDVTDENPSYYSDEDYDDVSFSEQVGETEPGDWYCPSCEAYKDAAVIDSDECCDECGTECEWHMSEDEFNEAVNEGKNRPGKGKRRDTPEEREGARQASIKSTEKTHRDKSKYTRKEKHRKPIAEESNDKELQDAIAKAKRISKEEGVAQHVNRVGNGYRVEDWYDSYDTVVSFQDGKELYEAGGVDEVTNEDFKQKKVKKTVPIRKMLRMIKKANDIVPDAGYALMDLAVAYPDQVPYERVIEVLDEYDLLPKDLREGILKEGTCSCSKNKIVKESKKAEVTSRLDRFRIAEIEIGIEYELGQMNLGFLEIANSEQVEKAKKKVLTNLEKDPNFYTHLKAGIKPEKTNKRADLPTYVDKNATNAVDNKNQMKKLQEQRIVAGLKKLILEAITKST